MSTDYRAMFDREHLGAWDLGTRDATVVIARVRAGELVGEGGRKTKKPIIAFEGKEKTFAANKTNCKIIAGLYGTDTRNWIGKRITLYATTTEMAGTRVDCIRVRPQVPSNKPAPQHPVNLDAEPPEENADDRTAD